MTAREMFLELGYVYYDNHYLNVPNSQDVLIPQDAPYLEYTNKMNECEEIIRFYPHGEFITAGAFIHRDDGTYRISAPLNMLELEAIMKQCEELGWLRKEE